MFDDFDLDIQKIGVEVISPHQTYAGGGSWVPSPPTQTVTQLKTSCDWTCSVFNCG